MRVVGSVWLTLLLLAGTVVPARAQGGNTLRNGVRVEASVGYLKPHLHGGSEEIFRSKGEFGGAEALLLGLGYDGKRLGATLGMAIASPTMGEHRGSALSLAALAHWYIPQAFRQWRPEIAAGYVRHALGGIAMHSADLPKFVIDTDAAGAPPVMVDNVGVLGNGFRLSLGARRYFGAGAFKIEATGDFVSFSSFSSDGSEGSIPSPGVSFIPRVAGGLVIWPFR
jgi:hypothetical protein